MTAIDQIKQIQVILKVVSDGDFGPISRAALDSVIRRSHEVVAPDYVPKVDAFTGLHPFVSVAAEWMGRHETSRNQFDGMEKVWADTNYPDGWQDRAPYCAAFQCHVVAEAKRNGAHPAYLPTSPSVSELRNWARKLGITVTDPKPGDHFTLLPSGTSHIGLVEHVNNGVLFTMEGNTDGSGGRDGDGFYRRTRLVSSCDFFRIPCA